MSAPIGVLIVDDHEVFTEGLALVLSSAPDLRCVGTAHTAAAGLELTRARRPTVVLLDHHLPDLPGAPAVASYIEAGAGAVVILTADPSDDVLTAAFEAGAAGYLLKTRAARHVLEAVRHAAAGETLISASALSRVLRGRAAPVERRDPGLSDRERQVLAAMAEGLDTGAIAERLGVTLSTARTYIQNVLEKLDARSRLQAVVRAKQAGLLER